MPSPIAVHPELGLPIYETSQVAWTAQEIASLTCSGVSRFLRHADLQCDEQDRNLPAMLDLANAVLREAAKATDAKLVPYNWGLARSNPRYNFLRHPAAPVGYTLVARVANVVNAQPLTHAQKHRLNIAVPTYEARRHTSGYFMYDLSPDQFVNSPNSGTYLVDIDPRLAKTPEPPQSIEERRAEYLLRLAERSEQ